MTTTAPVQESNDSAETQDYLGTLLNLGQILNSSLEPAEVLETASDQVIAFVGAERGFILLVDPDTRRVWGETTRNIEKASLEATLSGQDTSNRAEISRTLVEKVLEERQPILSHNAMEDPRFKASQSVQLTHLRSVLCVPLIAQSRLLGIIYLDNRVKSGVFTERHLAMLAAFANQAAVAIENARLYDNLRRSLEDRLRLQDELHSQETKRLALEEAGRLKSDFIGFVAHELRNPLTTIRGTVQTLLADPEDTLPREIKEEFYEAIEADADRLLDMINELLDVSRLEAGRPLSLALRPVELRPLLEKLARRHRFHKYFSKRHEMVTQIAPDTPEIIEADDDKLNQIISNFLSNAIKYSPEGGRITLAVRADGPDHVVITVSDEGVGMNPEQIARLFRQYERVERDAIKNIPGTGLGLFLVKNLIELHHGVVGVESAPGQGSAFSVRLPVRQPEDNSA